MASQERREPRTPGVLNDETALDDTARILSYASVAARYTLRHAPMVDGDRRLAVAQYAERFVDTLGTPPCTASLETLVATVETNRAALHERLDSALHRWAKATQIELSHTIPASQVMANIADLGTMMLAATHHLRTLEPDTSGEQLHDLTAQLRSGAESVKAASSAWKSVTTLQPRSHEFGAVSLELFKVMRGVIISTHDAERSPANALDVGQALCSLQRGVDDLTRFMTHANDATRACLNGGLSSLPPDHWPPISSAWPTANAALTLPWSRMRPWRGG